MNRFFRSGFELLVAVAPGAKVGRALRCPPRRARSARPTSIFAFTPQIILLNLGLAVLVFCATPASADDNVITIKKDIEISQFPGLTPPTPIAITGFPSEIEHVLNFDLTVMGFVQVPYDGAQYVLSGSANGNVQGQLSFGKTVIFSQIYNGANQR